MLIFLFLAVLTKIAEGSPQADETTLKLVVILNRHGFRTPLVTFKSDPYKNEDSWPVPMGELLKEGKTQMYKLGKTLQTRYEKFINKYSTKTVKVRSSDIDRSIMTVAIILAAWFPPKDEEELWKPDLLWQPIPIHTVPLEEDNMLYQDLAPCPTLELEKEKVNADIKANETEEDTKLYSELSEHVGEQVTTVQQIEDFFYALLIEEKAGKTLPDWTKGFYPDRMLPKVKLSREALETTMTLRRLKGGVFLNELLQKFTDKSKGVNDDLKLLIYSAHDTTMWSVWKALDIQEYSWPDFGSAYFYELHHKDDQYSIKMFYMKHPEDSEPDEIQIPNCQPLCTIEKLNEITTDVRPGDWHEECNAQV